MALLVFAGSSQLASVPLLLAGAPAWVILATGFCVNLRFVVSACTCGPSSCTCRSGSGWSHGYFTADPELLLFTQRFHRPASEADTRKGYEAYLAGSDMVNWASWMLSNLAGVALANWVPQSWGLGFAGILCLVGILCSLASNRLRVLSALVAATVAIAAFSLPPCA